MAFEVLMLVSHGLSKKKKSAWQKINGAAFYKMGELITAVFITGTQKKKSMGREDGMVKSESLTFISLCY